MAKSDEVRIGRKQWMPWAAVVLVFLLAQSGRSLPLARVGDNQDHPAPLAERQLPQRIVSLAPSVTEVLFALNLGDRVVGVTHHCRYPSAVLSKEKVGDYYHPDYEAILSLRPDLVILLPEHEEAERYLSSLGVKTLRVNHFTIPGILDSILRIGQICGTGAGEQVVGDIRRRMETIRSKTAQGDPPRVMVSLGRNMGPGIIKDAYICGHDGFYSQMIELAGGKNAYPGGGLKFPTLSAEGIIRLNPQVILEIVPDLTESGWREEEILRQWAQLKGVDAVVNHRVHVLSHDYAVVPGPRFILILEEMARRIHPEVR
ncbi:MAG: helical backbone metal receptor [candidate division NC10 bacterium]|nr:helical backbone metal receptor [candidate division NC10 bacterium]